MSEAVPEMLPAPTPRPFAEIPPLWLRIGQMSEAFFSAELPRAKTSNTLLSVLILAGSGALLTAISAILGGLVGFSRVPTSSPSANAVLSVVVIAIVGFFGELIIAPASFYLNNGVLYLMALLFGGKGKFGAQTYLATFFQVPLVILSGICALTSVIPTFGIYITGILTLAISLYILVLNVRMLKVAHTLSTGKVVAAIFLPFLLLLIPVCIIAVLLLTGPMIGNVFSSINSSLMTPMP